MSFEWMNESYIYVAHWTLKVLYRANGEPRQPPLLGAHRTVAKVAKGLILL